MSIGDWFMINGEPATVLRTSIVGGHYLKGKSAQIYRSLGSDLTPIPISSKLMGQIAEKVGIWSYHFCKGVFIDTGVRYKWVERLRVYQGKADFTVRGKIRYVHQLQHLLRIAGVEKEITL